MVRIGDAADRSKYDGIGGAVSVIRPEAFEDIVEFGLAPSEKVIVAPATPAPKNITKFTTAAAQAKGSWCAVLRREE
jgi:hypothetical protein